MLFNSIDFIFFLGAAFLIYWILPWNYARIIFLLIVSLIFYMSWNVSYIFLILTVIIVDFNAGRLIKKYKKKKKQILYVSIIINLGLLFVFKYYNFFLDSFNPLLSFIRLPEIPYIKFLLPVGISFYIFQSMSYTIDIYRGVIKPEKSIFKYAFFVSYFPQLVAGPIVRARDFLYQINKQKKILNKRTYMGILMIFIGLFKKVVIADFIATNIVDGFFANPHLYTSLDALLAVYGYAFQIYNDFSGYSDIAIGSALLFGFYLPLNFNNPYTATSIRDFWKRWHISLSTWIRDYVYISLGGNRVSRGRMNFNLLATWFLCGLWHGAAWNFILWGMMHGVGLMIEANFRNWFGEKRKLPFFKITSRLLTFHFVCFSWIFFRAKNFIIIKDIFKKIFHFSFEFRDIMILKVLGMIFIGFILHYLPREFSRKTYAYFIKAPFFLKLIIILILATIIGYFSSLEEVPFIYFQF